MGVEQSSIVVVAVLVGVVEVLVEVDVLVEVEVLVDVDEVLVEVDVVEVPVVPVVRVVPVVPVVLVVVGVVPRRGVLFGDAWACAGTTTDSTIGLIHLEGRTMVTVRPPTARISRARRRVSSVIR
jgi:hypothetical protein